MALSVFTYGGFQFDPGSVSFSSIDNSYIVGQTGRPHMIRRKWNLKGKLVNNSSQSALMSSMTNIINAFTFQNLSAGFQGTPFYFDNSVSLGGVLVTQMPSFSDLKGAQGVTYIPFSFALQTDEAWASRGTILEFKEQVSFSDNGGNPMTVERLPQNAPPIIQTVSYGSWYYCTQQGSVKTAFSAPNPIPPLFPGFLRTSTGNASQITRENRNLQRGTVLDGKVSWKYDFISAQPFAGGDAHSF